MLLSLDSEQWEDLRHAYGSGTNIPPLLRRLLAEPNPKSSIYEQLLLDVWNLLCHQGTVASASYAAMPYIVQVATKQSSAERLECLQLIGHVEVFRENGLEPDIPEFLQPSYFAAHRQAIKLVLESLQEDWSDQELQILLSTLAILKGKQPLGAAIGWLHRETTCPACRTEFPTEGYSWFIRHE